MFLRGVLWVVSVQFIGVDKDGARLFEGDTMFFEVGDRLRDVPCEHILVYTLMLPRSQVSVTAMTRPTLRWPATSMSLMTFTRERCVATASGCASLRDHLGSVLRLPWCVVKDAQGLIDQFNGERGGVL